MNKIGLMITAMTLVSVCHANIVSWNYNRYGDAYAAQSTDVAGMGAYSASYWNDSWLDGRTTDLLDNTGAATTIDISWESYNNWSIQGSHPGTDTDGSYNKEILNGYLNSGPAGWNPPLTYSAVTLSQIGYSSYDIVVYFSSDVAGREGYITDGSTTYYFNTLGPASIASGNALFVRAADTTEAGYAVAANYAVFSGLSGAGQTVTIQMRDNDEWGGVAAVQIAEVTTIVYDSPDNGAELIPVERNSVDNDLIFTVIDPNITEVDVHFGTEDDPNLTADPLGKGYKIVDGMSVTPGQYTITLETELAADLSYNTTYYWKVIGYEPNDVGFIPVPGPVFRFTTVPETPVVSDVVPAYIAVDAGQPTVDLSVSVLNGSPQWYKEGVGALSDSVGVYTGTDTDTLTIYDVQEADEGYYYCVVTNIVGTDTSASGRVLTKRLMSYYPFETTSVVEGDTITPDVVGGFDAVLSAEGGQAVPVLSDANQLDLPVALGGGSYALLLDNGDNATDPNGQYAQLPAGVVDYEDITVSAWVHPKSVAVWARVFDFGNDTSHFMFVTPDIGVGYDPRFAITTGSGEQQLTPDLDSANWIGPGGWHYIAITLNGDTGRMYVDGVLRATNTDMTINPINLGAALNYIGKSQFAADPEFDGLIDELKIYNYALSTVEIGREYLTYADPTGYVCNLEATALPYDYNGNCRIDLPDFAAVAEAWLDSNRIILP